MKIVYDGYEKGNVFEFANKIGYPIEKIENFNNFKNDDIFLITKTVGFGKITNNTEVFLNKNYLNVIGVAVSGNRNFGKNYAIAGDLISQKFNIPFVFKFEGNGLTEDVEKLKKWLENYEKNKNENKYKKIPSWIIFNNQIIDEEGNIKNIEKIRKL